MVIKYLHILHLAHSHGLQQPLFFSRDAILGLPRASIKTLALLHPIIGTFSKVYPYSWSSVNSKCISDIIVLRFENKG